MSEWKWCLRCGHRFDQHARFTDLTLAFCRVEGCNCEQFEQEVANFL